MKRWMALFGVLCVVLNLVGCAGGTRGELPQGEKNTNQAASANTTATIPADAPVEGEITVSCYDTVYYKDFLESTAKAFEQKYPGTKVNIDASSKMPDMKSSESGDEKRISIEAEEDAHGQSDYINKINTSPSLIHN